MEKVSLICTVFNEEKSLPALLSSIESQEVMPHEVVIVDGGSSDTTVEILKQWKPKLAFRWMVKPGNRSVCRNLAIEHATGSWIAITDAGCVLDRGWLDQLIKTQQKSKTEIISGYAKVPINANAFQRAVVLYFIPQFVTPPKEFLPATRSMMIKKTTWLRLGKFPEDLFVEDYVFAKKAKSTQIKMAFAPNAIVYWAPPKTLVEFAHKTTVFAEGDVLGGVLRKKAVSMYFRYIIFIGSLLFSPITGAVLLSLYLFWAVLKHKRADLHGIEWLWVPFIQVTSDMLVMYGTTKGILKKLLNYAK